MVSDNYLEEIKEDMKSLTLEEVMEKYGLSFKELFELTKQTGGGKYIRFNKKTKTYSVTKSVNGEYTYFGTYSDRDEAFKVRDELIKCKWDIDKLPEILWELGIKSKCGVNIWTEEW